MLRNYLTVAIRNALRQATFSAINVIGLAVGIGCCLLIYLFVQDELQYDRYHAKAERTYRILWHARLGDNEFKIPLVSVPLADVLDEQFPEVEHVVRMRKGSKTVRHGQDFVNEGGLIYTEPSFFSVFTVHFVEGNAESALDRPESIVLTMRTAERYFRNEKALGREIELNDGTTLRVSAVVEEFPSQSHFRFDFLAPLSTVPIFQQRRDEWGSATVYTYFTLREGADPSGIEAKLGEFARSRDQSERYEFIRYPLQSLVDIHLRSHLGVELRPNGSIQTVYIFSIVAGFVLVLACINFVNLSTARSVRRSREVGLRKVMGCRRGQLVLQYLLETLGYVVLAVVLAIGLTELALPFLNDLAGKTLDTRALLSLLNILAMIGLLLTVTLAAGTYPALILSAFWPVQAMRGGTSPIRGGKILRNGLVVVQFCVSIGLLIGTLVVSEQLRYTQSKRLGFDKEHVLVVRNAGAVIGSQIPAGKRLTRQEWKALLPRMETFREQLAALPRVSGATITSNLPGRNFDSVIFKPEQPANYEETSLSYVMVDEHYVDVLKLDVVEGRGFDLAKFPADSSAFLINESAAQALGWQNPVGRGLKTGGGSGTVIGIVKDFHYASLHHEVGPLVLPYLLWGRNLIALRLRSGDLPQTIESVRVLWERFVPNQPFRFSFLDEDYARLYRSERRVATVIRTFTGLAVFIGCLGLLGLAAFAAEQRTQEIGIRKVLGASVESVVLLLSKDLLRLVLIAFVVAVPPAWYAMDRWLQSFAYRVEVEWEPVVLAGVGVALLALVTVSTQALRVATANPAETLRDQ